MGLQLNHAPNNDMLNRIKVLVIYVECDAIWSAFSDEIGATNLGRQRFTARKSTNKKVKVFKCLPENLRLMELLSK
jgi:hypothetical protein